MCCWGAVNDRPQGHFQTDHIDLQLAVLGTAFPLGDTGEGPKVHGVMRVGKNILASRSHFGGRSTVISSRRPSRWQIPVEGGSPRELGQLGEPVWGTMGQYPEVPDWADEAALTHQKGARYPSSALRVACHRCRRRSTAAGGKIAIDRWEVTSSPGGLPTQKGRKPSETLRSR